MEGTKFDVQNPVLISVIMPVYNAESYLDEAIQSILGQTEPRFEFLIINDGSTDRSEEIIKSYTDPRIRYIRTKHKGVASARNTGLDLAKGEFVVWQDADDVSLPNRLERLLEGFRFPNVAIVHSDMLLIDKDGHPIGYWQSHQHRRSLTERFMLEVGTPFNNSTMMIRRSVIGTIRFNEELKIGEDTDMVVRLAEHVDSLHIPEPLVLYRRHTGSLTCRPNAQELFLHVYSFLERHSVRELVPELDWGTADTASCESRAYAVVALILSRRGMRADAERLFETAIQKAQPGDHAFLEGIGNLILGRYSEAIQALRKAKEDDAVVENYLGEAYALLGDYGEATSHFLKAIRLKPDYVEPVINLRAVGSLRGLNLIDSTWRRFK